MRSLALFLIAVALFEQPADAQLPSQRRPPRRMPSIVRELQAKTPQQAQIRRLFGIIEQGIMNSTVSPASTHFAQHVFVNMAGGESGYYSSNQTASILQRYFSGRMAVSFEFSRYNDVGATPYATGRFVYIARGRRESAQIYVSLRFQDSRWVVNQFNIY